MATTNKSGLQIEAQSAAHFAATLQRGVQAALEEAWKTLQAWGREYKQRVERATPVDRGAARESWFLAAERSAASMTVTLANRARSADGNRPYAIYLEFGTHRIAGGRVKAWRPGEAPVTAWPAKTGKTPARAGGRSAEGHGNVISNAFASNPDAQMPILRPIGYELAPQIVVALQQALVRGFQSAARSGGKAK